MPPETDLRTGVGNTWLVAPIITSANHCGEETKLYENQFTLFIKYVNSKREIRKTKLYQLCAHIKMYIKDGHFRFLF